MFVGKVCVINGAAKGIGRQIAEEFAARGCNIAFMDGDKESGRRFKKVLQDQFGVDALFFHGSTYSEEDLEIFANAVIGQYEKIDFFINNTSINKLEIVEAHDSFVDIDDALRLGAIAPYILHKSFEMHFNPGAAVVYMVPRRDIFAIDDDYGYQLVKESVESLTQLCARRHQGLVRANCISPDIVENANNKEKADIAKTISFMCEGKAEFLNGNSLPGDGGIRKMLAYHGKNGWNFVSG